MPALLGLDIGTTSTIGILIDDNGQTLATAKRPTELYSEEANWAEEDPDQWWVNVGDVTHELLALAGIPPTEVSGIGVTGMLPAVVLVDAQGHAIRRSIQQNDARATNELDRFSASLDENEFLERTGTGYSQQLVGPKLMWLRDNEPENFNSAVAVVGSSDFITFRLTGTLQVEHNWALESGFVDLTTGAYAKQLVALSGTDPSLLPPIRRSEEVVGRLQREAARHLGLPEGIPVVAGCADHVASAFVCGASSNGDLVIKFGGAADILLSSDTPVRDRRLFMDYHIVPGLYFPNGCMAAGGNLLNWIIANLAGGEVGKATESGMSPHQWLDKAAEHSRSELLFLPYILGEKTPLMDPHARGTLVGLGLHHTIADIWRAALEGIVFGMRHHVDTFVGRGLAVTNVKAADGGAASDLWLQIAADVLERPVQRLDQHPGSCLGAAFVAGMGTGLLSDWSRIDNYVELGRVFTPRESESAAYAPIYANWRESYERLKDLYPKLTAR
ncbi:MAG: carbohydrate kinase [Hyphomicrobiales bacterium]|nr:carbohydrate kinase [Hyphomicrobiales bacterium]